MYFFENIFLDNFNTLVFGCVGSYLADCLIEKRDMLFSFKFSDIENMNNFVIKV